MAKLLIGLHRAGPLRAPGPLLDPQGQLTPAQLVGEQLQVLLVGEDPLLLQLPDLRKNPDYGNIIFFNPMKVGFRKPDHVFYRFQQRVNKSGRFVIHPRNSCQNVIDSFEMSNVLFCLFLKAMLLN